MLYLQHLAVYYVDTKRHVIPTVARKDAIYKCYQAAKNRGFHGLLFRTADGVHQVLQLTRHMRWISDKCGADGKGGPWAKQLYA